MSFGCFYFGVSVVRLLVVLAVGGVVDDEDFDRGVGQLLALSAFVYMFVCVCEVRVFACLCGGKFRMENGV